VVGKLLGEHEINIASMQVGRDSKGGKALIALTVDTGISADLLETIRTAIGADMGRRVDIEGE
jgi:D-3-phosphoglycerate dehydrogenase